MKKIFAIAAMALLTFTAANAQVKIGHVNFVELVQLAPEADSARETLAAVQKDAEETYQDMIDEYNNKLSQYQSKSSSWTAAVKESKEKELMQIQNNIQEFQQSISQELQAKQNELMAPLYEKAQNAVNKVAKAQGISVVFDNNSALYYDPATTVDLTAAARKELGIPEGRTLESLAEQLNANQQ